MKSFASLALHGPGHGSTMGVFAGMSGDRGYLQKSMPLARMDKPQTARGIARGGDGGLGYPDVRQVHHHSS